MSWTFVSLELVQELQLYQPKQSVIEMAHLLAYMEWLRAVKRERFRAGIYCERWGVSDRTVRRHIQFLERIGAITNDPSNRLVRDLPDWSDPATTAATMAGEIQSEATSEATGEATMATPPTYKKKRDKTEKITKPEDAAVAAWNAHKPETWAKLTKLTPLRIRQISSLYKGQGGMTQFISDIPVAFAGLRLIGKRSDQDVSFWVDPANKRHHNWGALFGESATSPKDHWVKAVEAGWDQSVPHSLKSPPPDDEHPLFSPHKGKNRYGPRMTAMLDLRPGAAEDDAWKPLSPEERFNIHREAWAMYTDMPHPNDSRRLAGWDQYGGDNWPADPDF